MPGLDPTIGKEAPILFLVLSFFIIFGYLAFRFVGKALDFVKTRDAAFLSALNKLSADLQNEQKLRDETNRLFFEKQNEMWRSFVKDHWAMMAKSLDGVANQIVSLGMKMDEHDRRTGPQHRPLANEREKGK